MHDYIHVQIKQTSKNYNFKLEFYGAFSTNIAILSPLAAILNFWRPSWILIGSLGIKTSNLNTSFLLYAKYMQPIRTTASNLSVGVWIGEFCSILSSMAAFCGHFGFLLDRQVLDFQI